MKKKKDRYDTQFYVKVIDEKGGNVIIDNREITNHLWFTPLEALQEFENGNINLSPPTWVIIKDLVRFKYYESLEREERCLEPIRPSLLIEEDGFSCILPGDHKYENGYREEDREHRIFFSNVRKNYFKYVCNLSLKQKNFSIPHESNSNL